MATRFSSMSWAEQQDRSVAADFLETVADSGGGVWQDSRGDWWLAAVEDGLIQAYGVTLRPAEPPGSLAAARGFRPPGIVRGTGERLTLDPRESDSFLAASFLLDRMEDVSWAADGTVLLDSPYAAGSTARVRNFADQFGLTVTLNDDPTLKPKWKLRRPRVALIDAPRGVEQVLDRYGTPWVASAAPVKPQIDVVIAGRAGLAEPFRKAGGTVLVAAGNPVIIDGNYPLLPRTAKILLRDVYLQAAHAV